MAITSYSTLRDQVAGNAGQSWSHRNDVLTKFDTFLQLTEQEMYTGGEKSAGEFIDGLRVRDMEKRCTATVSTTSRFLQLPDNYLQARRAELEFTDSNSNKIIYPLKYVITSELKEQDRADRPVRFTVTSQIEFDCTPDLAYVLEMQHYAKLTAISSTNATNAILTNFPTIYLYGCLSQMYKWSRNVEQGVLFHDLFLDAIYAANKRDKWARVGPAPQMIYHESIA